MAIACLDAAQDPGAMTRLIDKLETMGLVRRGRQTHADMTRVQIGMLNRALRGFSSAEARALKSLLERMLGNMSGE